MQIDNLIIKILTALAIITLPICLNNLASLLKLEEIIFIDVGQGDATLICTFKAKCGLIDTGKNTSILNSIRSYTSNQLEFLILTHPDLDHYGKSIEVLNEVGIKSIFINITDKSTSIIKELLAITPNIFELNSLNDFYFGEYFLDILWPIPSFDLNSIDSNDGSISIKVTNKDLSVFIGGDLGSKIEDKLIENNLLFKVDILKLSHHGSKNSSSKDFLLKSNPKIGVITSGKNSYGHPSKQVLDILTDINLEYFRTDKDGDIIVRIEKNENILITTKKSKKSYIILN